VLHACRDLLTALWVPVKEGQDLFSDSSVCLPAFVSFVRVEIRAFRGPVYLPAVAIEWIPLASLPSLVALLLLVLSIFALRLIRSTLFN
jgi:hypothetical protein